MHAHTVQEQPVKLGIALGLPVYPYSTNGVLPDASFRFTEFYNLLGGVSAFNLRTIGSTWAFGSMTIQDCYFAGAYLNVAAGDDENWTVRNNCFDKVGITFSDYSDDAFTLTFQNNLVYRGGIGFDRMTSTTWTVSDNAFDMCGIEDWSDPAITHFNNAYFNTSGVLNPPYSGDVTNASFAYVQGPLGNFYHSSTNLFNRGSTTAGAAGLYHYTTTTNQVRETNSTVDIGFHYVALGTNGWAIDTDEDGLPDYWEDANGNGTRDAGETSIADSDSDDDDLSDATEVLYFGTDPNDRDMDDDGHSDGDEIWYGLDPLDPDPPYILELSEDKTVFSGSNVTLSVTLSGSVSTNYHFQWRRNGRPLASSTNNTLTMIGVSLTNAGLYSVSVSNLAGSATSGLIRLTVWTPGAVAAWGWNDYHQVELPTGLTNKVGIAAGSGHALALSTNGTIIAWGENAFGQTDVPTDLTNAVVISAGGWHSLALKADGTVSAWGRNDSGQTNVPAGLNSVVAISSGYGHCLALRSDSTVVAWGDNSSGQVTVPFDLGLAVAISAGRHHSLALKNDGTIVAWGENLNGESSIPSGLTNVLSIAAGNGFSAAILSNATVRLWGQNYSNQTNAPAMATNLLGIALGNGHVLALKSEENLIAWGKNDYNQTNPPTTLGKVSAMSANADYSLVLSSSNSVANVSGQSCSACGDGFVYHTDPRDTDYDGRSNTQEASDGTNPNDPNSVVTGMLGKWRFNEASWMGEQGQLPKGSPLNARLVAGWSGGGIELDHPSGAYIKYRDVEADNTANINGRKWTIRFWFRPNWASASVGGGGPLNYAELFRFNSSLPGGGFGFEIDPDGDTFTSYSANPCGGAALESAISWQAGAWHQITATFTGAAGMKVYVDGVLLHSYDAYPLGYEGFPDLDGRAEGFVVGNGCRGTIDELETYNYAKSSATILLEYNMVANVTDSDRDGLSDDQETQTTGTNPNNPDSDGDGMDDGWEFAYGLSNANSDLDGDGLTNLQEYRAGTDPSQSPTLTIWTARPKGGSNVP